MTHHDTFKNVWKVTFILLGAMIFERSVALEKTQIASHSNLLDLSNCTAKLLAQCQESEELNVFSSMQENRWRLSASVFRRFSHASWRLELYAARKVAFARSPHNAMATHRADAIQFDSIRCGVVALWLLVLFCNYKELFATIVIPCHKVSWSLWSYSCCKASTYHLEDRVTVLRPVPLTVTQISVFSQGFKYQCCNARFKHQFPVLEQETCQED